MACRRYLYESLQNAILPSRPPSDNPKYYKNFQSLSLRFGDIEKIRSRTLLENNKYTFMLPIRGSNEVINIDIPVVSSYADEINIKSNILQGR